MKRNQSKSSRCFILSLFVHHLKGTSHWLDYPILGSLLEWVMGKWAFALVRCSNSYYCCFHREEENMCDRREHCGSRSTMEWIWNNSHNYHKTHYHILNDESTWSIENDLDLIDYENISLSWYLSDNWGSNISYFYLNNINDELVMFSEHPGVMWNSVVLTLLSIDIIVACIIRLWHRNDRQSNIPRSLSMLTLTSTMMLSRQWPRLKFQMARIAHCSVEVRYPTCYSRIRKIDFLPRWAWRWAIETIHVTRRDGI